MEFYLKLASVEDDEKLKGIVLFEDFGKEYYRDCKATLTLGLGKREYYVSSNEEFYIPYADEITEIFENISSILPDARMCYDSGCDDGSGESDVMLKKENDPEIYHCSTLWFEDGRAKIGSDKWCDRVIEQAAEEEAEWKELMDEIED